MVILNELLIIFVMAGLVVFFFTRLGLPTVVGLLVAGILVGPHAFGWVKSAEDIHLLAEIGVVVLLFSVGLEFSLSRLLAMSRLMLRIGVPQVLLCMAIATLLTLSAMDSYQQAIFIGMLVTMSSTAVVLKEFADRGELDAPHGRISVAVLLLQDLLVVVFVLSVPLLAPQPQGEQSLWLSLLIGFAVVFGILLAGKFLLPGLLYLIVRTRNRELFLIAIFLICIGTACLTGAVGLSLALGAFLAGLTLSESEYGHQTMAEILPFRDTLSSLFFISVGMLLNLGYLWDNLGSILAIVLILLVLKFIAVFVPALLLGYPVRTSLLAGLSMAQIGEFSFVLAESGLTFHILNENQYQSFLAAAVITMALTPFLILAGPRVADYLATSRRWSRWIGLRQNRVLEKTNLHVKDHVIIAGFGFNGQNLATALRRLSIPYVVLESNPVTVRKRTRRGEPMIYGDCTRPAVLSHAGIQNARVFVVAISDPVSTRRAVQIARQMNPDVRVVVRTRYQSEIEELCHLGATHVIPEEFETSVAIFMQVLEELSVGHNTVRKLVEEIRERHYDVFRHPDAPLLPAQTHLEILRAVDIDTCLITGPSGIDGRSIANLQLRKRTGASVIGIRRGNDLIVNPAPDTVLRTGDIVILLGTSEQIAAALETLLPGPTRM